MDLDNRMKLYEQVESARRFLPLLPVVARLDGKCFHKFTKNMKEPFDENLTQVMIETTKYLVEETNAIIGYTQSDEITLIYCSDNSESQIFFDGRIFKMVSVIASLCTAKFSIEIYNKFGKAFWERVPGFDCRAWTVPNKMEAVNNLVWRELDASKNSIFTAARCHFSHNELKDKNSSQLHEMLFSKGVNWNDYPNHFKRGTYVQSRIVDKFLTDKELQNIPEKYRPTTNIVRNRNEIQILNLPPISKIENKVEVVFEKQDPIIKEV